MAIVTRNIMWCGDGQIKGVCLVGPREGIAACCDDGGSLCVGQSLFFLGNLLLSMRQCIINASSAHHQTTDTDNGTRNFVILSFHFFQMLIIRAQFLVLSRGRPGQNLEFLLKASLCCPYHRLRDEYDNQYWNYH